MIAGSMTIDRFRHLAEAYGGDLNRWPVEMQAAAHALRASDEQARAILAAEAELDALVALRPAPAPAPGTVVANLLDAVPGGRARGVLAWLTELWPGEARWPVPAFLSLAFAIGILAGGNLPWNPLLGTSSAQAQTQMQTGEDDLLGSALALGPSSEDIVE